MRKLMSRITYMQTLGYQKLIKYIKFNVDESFFEPFMSRKYLGWIYNNKEFSVSEKKIIIEQIKVKMPYYARELELNYCFIEKFFPIAEKLYEEICDKIKGKFKNSMFIFSYCIGKYTEVHPDIIGKAKELLIKIAMTVLEENLGDFKMPIIIPDAVYYQHLSLIEELYKKAIKYGVLQEKYDAISFVRERIMDIIFLNKIPMLTLCLVDKEFERGLQYGCQYENYLSHRKVESDNPIYEYYKCKICRYCSLIGISDDEKDVAINLLNRQFLRMKFVDAIFFYTGTLPSYVLSFISLIYTEIVKLILFSDQSYVVFSKNEIRKNMMWGDRITNSDFDDCYNIIINREKYKGYFLPLADRDSLLIGKWMFDLDMSIIECAKSVSLDAQMSERLAKSSNFFGKEVFEKIVRDCLKKYNWQVVENEVKLKNKKQFISDVDLLAYKEGIVLIGEIKVAHCERSSYQIWKASVTLRRAQTQVNAVTDILKNDLILLRSIFAKCNIKLQEQEIKHIIPIVVTTSSYFTNPRNKPIIVGFDMLCELMNYVKDDYNQEIILQALTDPISMFPFSSASIINSVIETDEFNIDYEELEFNN